VLTADIESLEAMMDRIPEMSTGIERAAALDRCQKRLRSAAGTKRAFRVEIRLLQEESPQVRRKYTTQLEQLDRRLMFLEEYWKVLQRKTVRGEVFVLANNEENDLDGATRAGDGIIKEASTLQDKTQDSLANMKSMIDLSKEAGLTSLEELERQRGLNIEKEVNRVDTHLARAESLLKRFGRLLRRRV
jgi:hypothetical protein